ATHPGRRLVLVCAGVVAYPHGVGSCYGFFFFQAEDGIRDRTVTGVQTCALPISTQSLRPRAHSRRRSDCVAARRHAASVPDDDRSEERRVGKERRARARPGELNKKDRSGQDDRRASTRDTEEFGIASGRTWRRDE